MTEFNFNAIKEPQIFKGDDQCAYRDPAVYYDGKTFYMYFTYVDDTEELPYLHIGMSHSDDLVNWSPMKLLTEADRTKNYSSPGNIIEHKGWYYMCLQTYCRENGEKYGNKNSRLFTIKSKDLMNWSEPEPIMVKGDMPLDQIGRMIDPYIIRDKDEEGKYWCFFKQNGASFSSSTDLKHWEFGGSVEAGENVCVIEKDDEYLIFHSPHNGIGILKSKDLRTFEDYCETIYLGQKEWPWAMGRITAGFVLDLTKDERFGKYIMFFHGSGPEDEQVYFDNNASLGLAWSDDLIHWEWPQ